jgi:protein gp37
VSQRGSGFARRANEDYPTPEWVTATIARRLRRIRVKTVWEPAAGHGALAAALTNAGFSVIATGDDFLTRTEPPHADIQAICTNPPYGDDRGGRLACRFIRHALALPVDIVAMLLRVDFDSGRRESTSFATIQPSPARSCSSIGSNGSRARKGRPTIMRGLSGIGAGAGMARRGSPTRPAPCARRPMAETTNIAWTDSTFNPWIGCTNVSPGCDHCYAEADNKRRKWTEWGPHGQRYRTTPAYWRNPIKWQKTADAFHEKHGRRQRVFCASLADVFDNQVPPEWREDLFALIKKCLDLDWQLLTKRPQNIAKMLPSDWSDGYPNVWLGATTESQEYFDQRWPILARTPAVVRFVSYEPALGPLRIDATTVKPDWLICGGESGPGARMMHPDWARDIRDQCASAGVKFFMKQMTKLTPIPDDLFVRQFPRLSSP